MTEENYNYRTSGLFLRNQFEDSGEFNIPIVPKAEVGNIRKTILMTCPYIDKMV